MSTKATRAPRPAYRCGECGWTTAKWVGRCGECQAWGTVEETGVGPATRRVAALAPTSPALPIGHVGVDAARTRSTGVPEFDRVLGGGIVPGAVVLLAGEPGVGKSTLLLEVAACMARTAVDGRPVLYVTGEESAGQVRLRAERIGAVDPGLLLAAETDLGSVLGHVDAHRPALLVLDSVQSVVDPEVEGAAAGVAQVRAVAHALVQVAKERGIPVLLVGHVTKDGGIAGPRVLEHLVDVVCQFDGDRHTRLRLVRAVKNRYGPTDEVGCFDLSDAGITGLADPSGLFLSGARSAVPGTCVTVTLEGRRPMPTEVQALVAPSAAQAPRRATAGLDPARVAMTLAVLQARLGVRIGGNDVYVSTVGGARAAEPATDLAVAIAVASAASGHAVHPGVVAVGEVGLTGEVRATLGIQRRVAEAARLGFRHVVVPLAGAGEVTGPASVTIHPVGHIREAVAIALGVAESEPPPRHLTTVT